MAIKINTAYGERLTSGMLNEKISNLVGGNEKLSGFDVSIASPTSVTIKPGKAIINGCAIEETSDTNTVVIDPRILSNDSIAYVVIDYSHENKRVVFSCVTQLTSSMVKLATLFIKSGVISELTNHNPLQTLNSIVSEAAEIEAQRVRDSIPSGFVELGGLDYDFMLNNENQVKLKTKSIAYVNGYRVEIPAGTIIDIGKSPEKSTREDLLFLEAWKDTDFSKNGKLKYRIRHVADVDFEGNYDGMSWSSWSYKSLTWAQGGNITPISEPSDTHRSGYEHAHFKNGAGILEVESNIADTMKANFNDVGLYIAGNGLEYYKNLLKTLDGYVYAIPMFRLYRKPSCGKSIPFEYSKINPKVNYNKFTKLMKEDKVERVVTENIQGRSLVNLINSVIGDNPLNDSGSYWGKSFTYVVNLKPNTLYTLIIDFELLDTSYAKLDSIILGDSASISNAQSNYRLWRIPTGNNVIQFTTPSDYEPRSLRFVIEKSNSPNKPTLRLNNCMIVEGDLSNKEIPEFFTGLKSLGEDDGNLITLKNGILNDDAYDINDGNQKLNTFPSVTHVLSENTIIPTIEAVVNKGDDSTPLEKLNSKLETEGNEIVEFTKIKGKTLQNLWDNASTVVTISTLYQRLCLSTMELVANKTYTLVVNVQGGAVDFKKFEGNEVIQTLQPGVHVVSYTPNINSKVLLIALGEVGAKYNMKALLLDGDFTNTPLEDIPFVEGIKSVGENENNKIVLKSCNKNIWTGDTEYSLPFKHCVHKQLLSKGTRFKLSYELLSTDYLFVFLSNEYSSLINHDQLYQAVVANGKGKEISYVNSQTVINNDEGYKYIYVTGGVGNSSGIKIRNIQLEEGDTRTDYTPPLRNAQEIYLKEPLRSLTSTVYDEIIGNKIIRRVEKLIFNGSEAWANVSERNLTNTMYFEIPMPIRWKTRYHLNNRFRVKHTGDSASIWTTDSEVCNYDDYWHILVVRIDRSKLTTQDLAGFKTWLANNPLEVYHEINPVEEYLENVYEKESIKTYQLDAPLRSLPNGIKDEIKNGVLIRRCGEYIINGSETFQNSGANANVNTECFTLMNSPSDLRGGTMCMSDKFIYDNGIWNIDKECIATISSGNRFLIRVTRSNLTSATPTGLKDWLQSNPIKVIYELAAPIETRLKEVKPQTADFSYNRQFAEGNWLRELPNGVKDTIENGKVIRRTTKLTLKGSELWELHSNNTTDGGTLYRYFLPLNTTSAIGTKQDILICDKLKVVNDVQQEIWSCENIHYRIDSNRAGLYIVRDNITTLQDFNSWLTNNPVSIITLLATPTKEELTNENCNYFPCHDFNTYCGSMYVGEGRNYVISDNKMPTEDTIVVETDFREIEGKAKVEDCKYKKNEEGYDTPYISSSSKNLLDISTSNILTKDYSKNYRFNYTESNNGFTISNNTASSYASIRFRVYLKAGVSYRIEYAQTGPYSFVDLNTLGLEFICNLNSNRVFKVTNSDYYSVNFYCTGSVSTTSTATFTDIRITEGETSVPFEPCNKTTKYLENTGSNDIDDLRHQVSLTGFNYDKILNESFDKLLRGEL